MEDKTKLVAYDGFLIEDNGFVRDEGVISYEFRNLGKSDVLINGIYLLPCDNPATQNQVSSVWKTEIGPNEKMALRFLVKFLQPTGRKLYVITKRYIN
jgi:hypothetical protein